MPLYAIGDVHGHLHHLHVKMQELPPHSCTIALGDIGLGFHPDDDDRKLEQIDDLLKIKQSKLLLMRGNHDNPAIWNESIKETQVLYDNIKFINDIDLYHDKETDLKIIMVGGAISVDREIRTEGRDYWKKEIVPSDAPQKVKNLMTEHGIHKADILITHSAPTSAPHLTNLSVPILNHYCQKDETLLDELISERQLLEKCLIESGANRNIHGHFHQSLDQTSDQVRYTCLNELEIKEITA